MEFFVRVAEGGSEGQESLVGVKENGMQLSALRSVFPEASLLKYEVNGDWHFMESINEVIFPKANQGWNEETLYIVVRGDYFLRRILIAYNFKISIQFYFKIQSRNLNLS
jgi:hypothetical protein